MLRWTRRRFLATAAASVAGSAAAVACGDDDRGSNGPAPAGAGSGTTTTWAYGDDRRQVVELATPVGSAPAAGWPVVVLVHGGFWQSGYDRSLMTPLVPSLVAAGFAVANIDYRSVGDRGGGWPGTLDDAAAALDSLATHAADRSLDVARVLAVGHSAGGHLAVWLAARPQLPAGAPGAAPTVVVAGALSQAGVLDLAAAAGDRLGGGAVQSLLGGGPDAVADRYAVASPAVLVPLGVPVTLVHGTGDGIVPVSQSRRYAAAATQAGDTVVVHEVPGDHFVVIDPNSGAWRTCLDAVVALGDGVGHQGDDPAGGPPDRQ